MHALDFFKALSSGILSGLLMGMLGCSSSPLQNFSRKDNRSTLDAETASDEPVQLAASLSLETEDEQKSASLNLLARFESADFTIESCRSGFRLEGRLPEQAKILLYAFDQSCQAKITRFRLGGEDYVIAKGLSFDTRTGAVNPFINNKGSALFVIVTQQLASRLDPNGAHGARFTIAENAEGKQWSIDFYELLLSTDRTQLVEGSSDVAIVTVMRRKPAKGRLVVPLLYEGTVTPGADSNSLPKSVILEDGQEQVSFRVQALLDTNREPSGELLKISIIPQGTFYTKGNVLQILFLDRGAAQLVVDRPMVSFGTRSRILPHSELIRIENKGSSPATQLSVEGLKAPFSLPGGFPGDHGTCGASIAPNSSCLLEIGLSSPLRTSAEQAFTLKFFDGQNSQSLALNVSGATRYAADLRWRDSLNFEWGEMGSAARKTRSFVIKNLGQATAQSIEMKLTGTHFRFLGGVFPGQGGNCRRDLAAKASCVVVLEATLTAEGSFESQLTVSYWNRFQRLSLTTELKAQRSSLALLGDVHVIGKNQAYSSNFRLSSGSVLGTRFELLDGPRHGTVKITGSGWTYKPALDFEGRDQFTVRALDSKGPSAPAIVSLRIAPRVLILSRGCSREEQGERIAAIMQKRGFQTRNVEAHLYNYNLVPFYDLVVVTDSLRDSSDAEMLRKLGLPLLTSSFRAARQLHMVSFLNHDDDEDEFERAFAYDFADVMAYQTLAPARRLYAPLDFEDLHQANAELRLWQHIQWLMQEAPSLFVQKEALFAKPATQWKQEFAFQDRGYFSWKIDLEVPVASASTRLVFAIGRCDSMVAMGPPGPGQLFQIEARATQSLEILVDLDRREYSVLRDGIRSFAGSFSEEQGMNCLSLQTPSQGSQSTGIPRIDAMQLSRLL